MKHTGVAILVLMLVLGATATAEATYITEGCPHGMCTSYYEWASSGLVISQHHRVFLHFGLPSRQFCPGMSQQVLTLSAQVNFVTYQELFRLILKGTARSSCIAGVMHGPQGPLFARIIRIMNIVQYFVGEPCPLNAFMASPRRRLCDDDGRGGRGGGDDRGGRGEALHVVVDLMAYLHRLHIVSVSGACACPLVFLQHIATNPAALSLPMG